MAMRAAAMTQNSVMRTSILRAPVCRSSRPVPVPRSSILSRRVQKILLRAEGDKSVTEEAQEAAEGVKDAAGDVKDEAKSAVDDAEAAFREQANKANQAVSQQGVVEGTVKKPLSQGTAATDPNNAWDESIKQAGKSETEALGTQISIPDALRFRGVGPEHINSRLAMIGVTTGYLTKLITGKNTLDQYSAAPLPVILTFILFIAASLIPITKGVTPEKAQQGIWTTKAEIYNGRLAMLGFISLIATDGWQWFSALQKAKGAGL